MADPSESEAVVVEFKSQPVALLVEELESLLARAKSGEIRSLSGVLGLANNGCQEFTVGEIKNRFERGGYLMATAMNHLRGF